MLTTPRFNYPQTRSADVVDDYHGTPVADPYRWLEDAESAETQAWMAEQNKLTRAFLDSVPEREQIKAQLAARWDFPRLSALKRKGERYFFQQNSGLLDQPVLVMLESLDGDPVEALDPNKLSDDGTLALTNAIFSKDGRLMAYTLSQGGSDWQTIHVRDIESGADPGDIIEWVKAVNVAWKPDGAGFYYNRHPQDGEVPPEARPTFNNIYYHQLGTPQAEDAPVFSGDDPGTALLVTPQASDDGDYLLLAMMENFSHNRFFYRSMAGDGAFLPLVDEPEGVFQFVGNLGDAFYFTTNFDAPCGRVIAVDRANPGRANWREVIPESEDIIGLRNQDFQPVQLVNNQLVVVYGHKAHHRVRIFDLDGALAREVELPGIGALSGLEGRAEDSEMFFVYESFMHPPTVYRYDFTSGSLDAYHAPEVDFDSARYATQQIFFVSKDGTRVPMFVTHKKGLQLDGENPVMLYGYGGFNVNPMPAFFSPRGNPLSFWLENGGVFAHVSLRGGAEFGEEWHEAGMFANKQNVFDDFIAAGEYLIANGYTHPQKLSIIGRSNGGLLVAACMLQQPGLFGSVICEVPVTDMLRYQHFTAGRYWTAEYGDAEADPEAFEYLYAYSPLHNVEPGATYPPILIRTAEGDDRVVPMHSAKFAATLQAADSGQNPVLLSVGKKAGHGVGKPVSKWVDEFADIYAFLFETLGMTLNSH